MNFSKITRVSEEILTQSEELTIIHVKKKKFGRRVIYWTRIFFIHFLTTFWNYYCAKSTFSAPSTRFSEFALMKMIY